MTGDLIATGELADQPKIHIWNSRNLDNYVVLKGLHKRGVHLLAFSNNDEYLVTCGLNRPSPVIIYEWKHSLVLVSVSVRVIFSSFIDNECNTRHIPFARLQLR
jgi:hypothetical protein